MANPTEVLDAFGALSADAGRDKWEGAVRLLEESAAVAGAGAKELRPLLKRIEDDLAARGGGRGPEERGLALVAAAAARVPDDIFMGSAKGWFDSCCHRIRKGSTGVDAATAAAVSALLARAPSFSDVSRHLSGSSAGLVPQLLPRAEAGCPHAARTLLAVLSAYPGSCGPAAGSLSKALVSHLRPDSVLSPSALARLYAATAGLGGGGRAGAGHRERWASLFSGLVGTLEHLLGEFGAFLGVERRTDGPEGCLDLPRCHSSNLLQKLSHLGDQIRRVSRCLSEMLLSPFPQAKEVNLTRVTNLSRAACLFAARPSSDKPDDVLNQLAALHLPGVWSAVSRLMGDAVTACREDCLPFAPCLLRFFVHVLEETSGMALSTGAEVRLAFAGTRRDAFNLLDRMVGVLGCASGFPDCSGELLGLILREAVPSKSKISLAVGKKGKKKGGGGNQQAASNVAAASTSPAEVAAAALGCLATALSACGPLVPAESHHDAAVALVPLGLDVARRPAGARPAPFDDEAARLNLCRVLFHLAASGNPSVPAPLQMVSRVLREMRAGERRPRVADFLSHALLTLGAVVRPRALPLDLPVVDAERLAELREAATRVHVYKLTSRAEDAGDKNVGEGPAAPESQVARPQKRKGRSEEPAAAATPTKQKPAGKGKSESVGSGPGSQGNGPTASDADVSPPKLATLPEGAGDKMEMDDEEEEGGGSALAGILEGSEEERKAVLERFYAHSGEAVVIPEDVRAASSNVPAALARPPSTGGDGWKEEGAEKPEEEAAQIDMEAIKSLFVPEPSSSDEEED